MLQMGYLFRKFVTQDASYFLILIWTSVLLAQEPDMSAQ
jgi:hypothetical protein